MAAQHVVHEVARKGHLAARLLVAREATLDQAGDKGAVLEAALHHEAVVEPGLEVVAQHVLLEKLIEIKRVHRPRGPDREGVVRRHEADRPDAGPLQPLGQQHAQGRMGESPLERIGDQEVALPPGEGLHQHLVHGRDQRAPFLGLQPLLHVGRQGLPAVFLGDHAAHAPGQVGGEGELRAAPARHLGLRARRGADQHVDPLHAQQPPHLAAEDEGVAHLQLLDIALLDLADLAPRPAAAGAQPQVQHRRADDGADIHPMTEDGLGVARPPAPVPGLHDAAEAVVGLQRIAAGGDEIDHLLEVLPGQGRIGRGGARFVVEGQKVEGLATGHAHHVLGQDVERALADRVAVEAVFGHRLARGLALQHLEPAGGHQQGAGGDVQPMVGAADALHQARGAFRRGQLDDHVDRAPVDAEVEGGGADHRSELAPGHGRLDLAPLLGRERTVVQGDGEVVVVDLPQLLEGELRLPAGVDEDERGLALADDLVDLLHGVLRGVAGPGHLALRQEHVDLRRRAGIAGDEVDRLVAAQPGLDHVRVVDRGREPDETHLGRERAQPRQAEGQKIAALGGVDRVDLVDHHGLEVLEIAARAFPGAEQGQLLGRGQQDVGRLLALTLLLGDVGVARAALHADRQAHLGDRLHQVARHVHRQGLERGDVEGVHPARFDVVARRPLGQFDQARQEPGERLAPARRRDQEDVLPRLGALDHLQLMAPRTPAAPMEPRHEARGQEAVVLQRPSAHRHLFANARA